MIITKKQGDLDDARKSPFANFTNNCNLNTKLCNEMYRSFATIHYLIISF